MINYHVSNTVIWYMPTRGSHEGISNDFAGDCNIL